MTVARACPDFKKQYLSQPTGVSYLQVIEQLSLESSEKAHDSQVTVIHWHRFICAAISAGEFM